MDKSERRSARKMHDQHSMDEAELRSAQQQTAGESPRVGGSGPSHGEEPVSGENSSSLRSRYQEALQRERDTWERVQGLPGEPGFSEEAWERWRDAVDARERAARLLINHALTGERSQSSSAPFPG